jgi:hypothetical protein
MFEIVDERSPLAVCADHRAMIAETREDFADVFRLRYDVYIDEQSKHYATADHENRVFTDELDEMQGTTIIVRDATGAPSATVRCTHLSDPAAYEYFERVFSLGRFHEWRREQLVVCSRLAVAPNYRRTHAGRAAFEGIYRHELSRGVLMCFQYCASPLRMLFRHYGFREYLPSMPDAVLGRAHRMVLLLDDIANLEAARSPFLDYARSSTVKSATREWFEKNFVEEGPADGSNAS